MPKYQLAWTDQSEPLDGRIVDKDFGHHTYTFETGSREDAEKIVETFMILNPMHDFTNHTITELIEENQ